MTFPETYPGTGTWTFRNLTRSYTFEPTLDSILISQSQPEALANLDCEVVDEAGTLAFANEDHVEATFTPLGGSEVGIFRGHLNAVGEASVADAEQTKRWVLSGQDYTAKLDDAIVRRRKKRKREKARRRIRWLLSYMRSNIWTLDGRDLSGVPNGDFGYVEAHDYFGMTVREALQHVADELRLFFYVDFDNVFRMFRTETVAAPFSVDNVSPDYSTTFPLIGWNRTRESTELHNAFLVTPETARDSRWTTDAASITAYKRQEAHISDPDLPGPIAAQNVGARAIAQSADPEDEATFECWEPGIYAGMSLGIVEGLWGHDITRIVRDVEIRAVDPHDDDQQARLHTTLTVTDRRPARLSHGDITNKNTRRRRSPADTKRYTFDDFTRTVTPPTLSEGSSVGNLATGGHASEKRTHHIDPWALNPGQDDTNFTESGFVWQASRVDVIGSDYDSAQPHTARPQTWGCPGGTLEYAFVGSSEHEQWWKMASVPAHPSNMAGMKFETFVYNGKSYGNIGLTEVVVHTQQPTTLREGVVVAVLTPTYSVTHEVVIPAELIPAAGQEMWVGFRPGWAGDMRDNTWCMTNGWPSYSGYQDDDLCCEGIGYAGRAGSVGWNRPSNGKWLTWSATSPDLGTSDTTPDGAPFDGGHTVQDAGYEGDGDAWSFSGDGFSVTAEAPSGKGIYYEGENANSDEPRSAWGDLSVGVEHTFVIDALGDTAAAGTRSIETTLVGQGEKALGTVHLGDGSRDAGVSVSGPEATVYAPVALTVDEAWKVLIDTRSGKQAKAKMWKASEPMPANWDVAVDMEETSDDDDRYTLWLRAGNGAGSPQTVTVTRTAMYEGAASGSRIVKERIGAADGVTRTFYTNHPYRPGSLRAYVNGIGVKPESEDGPNASFVLDFWPTAPATIRATYLVE